MRAARIIAAFISIAAASMPLAAFAQQTDAAPAAQATPTYARPAANGEETIHGRISSFDGKYHLNVRDDRGFVDSVDLHQGTIINPTGLELQPGMTVTIAGFNRGRTFAANEIDTPYQAYGVVPFGYSPVSIGIGFGPVYFHHWH
jgi:invasion protein IalB